MIAAEAPADEVIGTRQFALLMGVTEKTIRNWFRRGYCPPSLPGGHARWRRSTIERWIAEVEESQLTRKRAAESSKPTEVAL